MNVNGAWLSHQTIKQNNFLCLLFTNVWESRYSGFVFCLSYLKSFLKNKQTVQSDLKIDLNLKLTPGCG